MALCPTSIAQYEYWVLGHRGGSSNVYSSRDPVVSDVACAETLCVGCRKRTPIWGYGQEPRFCDFCITRRQLRSAFRVAGLIPSLLRHLRRAA